MLAGEIELRDVDTAPHDYRGPRGSLRRSPAARRRLRRGEMGRGARFDRNRVSASGSDPSESFTLRIPSAGNRNRAKDRRQRFQSTRKQLDASVPNVLHAYLRHAGERLVPVALRFPTWNAWRGRRAESRESARPRGRLRFESDAPKSASVGTPSAGARNEPAPYRPATIRCARSMTAPNSTNDVAGRAWSPGSEGIGVLASSRAVPRSIAPPPRRPRERSFPSPRSPR